MALLLSQLCKNTENLYSLKLVAGKNGMENTVRWVHMVEDTEVPDFLHGNELVFTTGIAQHRPGWLLDFVTNLCENHAAGLVVNIGPYISSIPPQVIVYCEKNDFPLFTMPWKTRIIDITYEFCRRIINNEKTERSLAEAFKNLITDAENKSGYVSTLDKSGFARESLYTVILIKLKEDGITATQKIASEFSSKVNKMLKSSIYPSAAFVMDKTLTIVRQNTNKDEINLMLENLKIFFAINGEIVVHAGVSESNKGYTSVPEIYRQAKAALFMAEVRGNLSCYYENLGVQKILLNVRKREILYYFHDSVFRSLIQYDKSNKTDYYNVLRDYLECGGSIQEVAKKTGVHRNTINYKIKQIKEILGIEMTAEEKMNMMLAYNISDIIHGMN